MRVLEIGGGNGYQASIIAGWGCAVTSLDLPDRSPAAVQYHRVIDYDGQRIPFPNASFDVVFSSNVLEHARNLPALLAETRRVLMEQGIALHIVPSTAWRFWTSLAHYPYIVKRLVGRPAKACAGREAELRHVLERRSLGYVIKHALLAGAHGEYPSAVAELSGYSQRRWKRVFEAGGFEVDDAGSTGIFYTGYALCPWLPMHTRRTLARMLGSACHVFVLRKTTASS